MQPLIVLCDNHMDVIWRRGCRQQYASVDGIIRPYADLEEEQIRRALRMADRHGVRYTLEQSLPLRLYLQRNPDDLPLVRRLVSDGRLELPGGGETLIDLNMVGGESLVRNHLYSIGWCQRIFGTRSDTAVGTDLFGYSAQFPQILRQLGYLTLANTSRLFDDGVPFWRGLDGSTVLVRPTWENLGLPQVFAGGGCTRPPSPCCDGEGCPRCGYRGMDLSDENVRSDEHLRRVFERIAAAEGGPVVLRITGEETLENEDALLRLAELAREHGFEPQFLTMSQLVEAIDGERLARLRAGQVAETEIAIGVERNAICTGCYASRIRLKLWNRRLEALLLAAEQFSAFAAPYGLTYPRLRLERLWNEMALLQFHDALTGSHSDGAYEELLSLCRNVARDAHWTYEEAARTLGRQIAAPTLPGYRTVAVLNPLPWPVDGTPVDIVLDVLAGETMEAVEILDPRGGAVACSRLEPVALAVGGKLGLRLNGLHLPQHGYVSLHYRAAGPPPPLEPVEGQILENEHYRLTFDAQGLDEVWDKTLDEPILRAGAGGLLYEEDYGSVWETMATPSYSCWVARHSSPTVTLTTDGNVQTAVIAGEFRERRAQHERNIARIVWRQEITLYPDVKRIYFRTTIDWDTHNGRLMLAFPLPFRTEQDEAWYEIPYGVLPRRRYAGEYGIHTRPNGDWPALNFVALRHPERDTWVGVFNHGTPCHRVDDGVLKMTVLRSPTMSLAANDTQGAREVGQHVFEAMVASGAGELHALNPVRLGQEFNTPFLATPVGPDSNGSLPLAYSLLGHENQAVAVSAVKLAEESDDLVIRLYEPYGRPGRDRLIGVAGRQALQTNLLEGEAREFDELSFGPHELKTILVRQPG